MLIADLILRVREMLQDMDADRYKDARILAAINLGVLDIRRKRPDLFIGRFSQPTPQFTLADTFDLPEIMIPPLLEWAIGWIEMSDDEYSEDGRASVMLKKSDADLGVA